MRKAFARRALAALSLGALGCAAPFGEKSCPEAQAAARARGAEASCKVLGRPSLLVESARDSLAQGDLETAYHQLALLHTLHPDSAENREQFRLAARLFLEAHFRHRTEPGSIWVGSEPQLMFRWLEQFFQEAEEFPQPQVEALFIGNHGGMFRDFLAYARGRPALSGWVILAADDNGIIYSIEGRRAESSGAQTGKVE